MKALGYMQLENDLKFVFLHMSVGFRIIKEFLHIPQAPDSLVWRKKQHKHNAELQRTDPGTKVTG